MSQLAKDASCLTATADPAVAATLEWVKCLSIVFKKVLFRCLVARLIVGSGKRRGLYIDPASPLGDCLLP
ncbi:hypothetical protein HMPREF9372_0722 [Sporosarcina newyorkensis 2681]|uniref:Uncharacterized protein n=1 Tax=Sporosarcina newyorkensis 2681 TaxID=1027292 RepID=F9DPJ2_9BACL|nr:hypothetical protein HMPREF9372_0722 [Sporosarcina newyorkensis 2681]